MRVVGVLLLLLLAGCSDPATEEPPGADGSEATADPLAAPAAWEVGRWWRYDLSTVDDPVTWVVTEDAGASWTVDVDHAAFRFFHDAFAQVSTIGAIGKSDLQGSQETGPIMFLDFPLQENKTWTMTLDGSDWDVQVVDVAGPTAEVRAVNATGAVRVYVYDAEVGWFRTMVGLDANGTTLFEATFLEGGAGYAGTYVRWDIHPGWSGAMTPGDTLFEMFQVPEDAGEIWYTVTAVCSPAGLEGDQGLWSLQVQPEDDGQAGFAHDGICPEPFAEQGVLDPHPGSWGVTGASGGGTVAASFIPRTLQEMPL